MWSEAREMRNRLTMAAAVAVAAFAFVPARAAVDPPAKPESENQSGPVTPAAAQIAPKSGKTLYCLKTEVSGSRIRSKLCLTKEQWADRGVDVTAQ